MDGVHTHDDDDMEDDEDEMDEDDEMDFGDETGSEDTSNTEDDGDDEDIDEVIADGDEWGQDEDEEDEDDLVHNEDDGADDEDERGDDDDEGDEPGADLDDEDAEILWQDMHGVNPETAGEDGEEEDDVAGANRARDGVCVSDATLQVPYISFTRTMRTNQRLHLTKTSESIWEYKRCVFLCPLVSYRIWRRPTSLEGSSDSLTTPMMVQAFLFLADIDLLVCQLMS